MCPLSARRTQAGRPAGLAKEQHYSLEEGGGRCGGGTLAPFCQHFSSPSFPLLDRHRCDATLYHCGGGLADSLYEAVL